MSADSCGGGGTVPRSRVSPEQLDVLLSFMEEHVDFAAGKQSVYSRFSASKLWRLLAERLNAAAPASGGARKSPDKWCRYWADIKYKARKKTAAGGALGDLSSAEERLRIILHCGGGGGGGARRASLSDGCGGGEGAPDEDACSDTSAAPPGERERLATEELLAEAAMRSALAAEKQAEAVTQGVELLRELVTLVRERLPPGHPPPPPHEHMAALQHHHHRL